MTARQILPDGLARDADIFELVTELAPPRAGRACRCVRHARTWPGALATQRNNDPSGGCGSGTSRRGRPHKWR